MLQPKEVKRALEDALPNNLESYALKLAQLFSDAANGVITKEEVKNSINSDPMLTNILLSLAGKEVSTTNALLSFGENTATGDVSIRDLAGRDVINFNIGIANHNNPPPKRANFFIVRRRYIIITGFFVFVLLYAFTPKSYKEFYNIGSNFYSKGNMDAAILFLNIAVTLSPDNPDAYFKRGIAYQVNGDNLQAIADLSASIDRRPDSKPHQPSYFNRGLSYYRIGKLEAAVTDFSRSIELSPDYQYAYCERGRALQQLKIETEAIADLRKCLELEPGEYYIQIAHSSLKFLNIEP